MARDTTRIYELPEKIRKLTDWAGNCGITELASINSLARKIDVPESTLKHAISNRISFELQRRISEAFGFSIEWTEWLDRQAGSVARRDSAESFFDRFQKWKSAHAKITIVSDGTTTKIDRRFADFSFAVPGSFDPIDDEAEIPLILSIAFDRRGYPVWVEEASETLIVGLREVDLEISHDQAQRKIEAKDIECEGGADGNFSAFLEGLEPPWWIVSTTDQRLMGRRLPNDGCDCVCRGFGIGDKLTATMKARVDSCVVGMQGNLFKGESEAKKAFIDHLVRLTALQGAEAILGTQILEVVPKDD
ncbi:hypothetical protein DYI24_11290 [Rhodopseudomonas sp. BR0C11]|uniref:hypothetical protein n=1 Tax=Rhodopseudomonas sp. BR0C11 TaxID=2269370 RepID=UPI0013DEF718|nr:hypothetical protein [Rhodopseudomonas sp. BR0C11]NEV77626.1 hypothetical protein [Rhodopseudomonas sp. BR0C11]